MIRSMYSGVSGLLSNQTKMDVIGNNIANVSTTAFKSSRVRFQDAISQSEGRAQAPTDDQRGGVNPKQVGLGVTIASIDTLFGGAPLQSTGRDLDLGIEGEGLFVVSEDEDGDVRRYTRDGAFYKDREGNLVTAEGLRVLGVSNVSNRLADMKDVPDTIEDDGDNLEPLSIPDTIGGGTNPPKLETFYIDGNGLVTGVYDDGETYYLGRVAMAKFTNTGGLEKLGGNLYSESRNSGEAVFGSGGEGGLGVIRQSKLEMSNVDLANEFTDMIITSRAYQANSRIITTSDEMLQELVNLKR